MCIAAASTYWWSSVISGNSSATTRETVLRQSLRRVPIGSRTPAEGRAVHGAHREHARTLCLSTDVSFFRRPMAIFAATRVIRSTSGTVYTMVSNARPARAAGPAQRQRPHGSRGLLTVAVHLLAVAEVDATGELAHHDKVGAFEALGPDGRGWRRSAPSALRRKVHGAATAAHLSLRTRATPACTALGEAVSAGAAISPERPPAHRMFAKSPSSFRIFSSPCSGLPRHKLLRTPLLAGGGRRTERCPRTTLGCGARIKETPTWEASTRGLYPPTAPSSTALAARHASRVSSVSGVPWLSMLMPPKSQYLPWAA